MTHCILNQDRGFLQKRIPGCRSHMFETPKSLTIASVVSRESVRNALTLAALNDLEVKTSHKQNAYLTSPCSEKVYSPLWTDFEENKGETAIIVRALYGLHHLVQASTTILQIACAAPATNPVWQTLISGTSQKYEKRTSSSTTNMCCSMLIAFASITQQRK